MASNPQALLLGNTVRMKALSVFTRNTPTGILHGDPNHPDVNGRYVFVSEETAALLEKEKLAKRSKVIETEEEDGKSSSSFDDEGDDGAPQSLADLPEGVSGMTAGDVRENNLRRGTGVGARGGKIKGPIGGSDTNATTNHPPVSGPESTVGLAGELVPEGQAGDDAPAGDTPPASQA